MWRALLLSALPLLSAQESARHSPLTQIGVKNVTQLRQAWVYHAKQSQSSDARMIPSEVTPVVANGVMYLSTGVNTVVALEPETGKQLWVWESNIGAPPFRGVSYWPGDRQHPPEILFATAGGFLVALNASTGKPVPGFGNEGRVNLKAGVTANYPEANYQVSSPPAIHGNLVIQGDRFSGFGKGPYNDIRAWDVRTGAPAWTFHTIPRAGEPGNDTWEADSWKDRGGVNVWGLMTVDRERGVVYAPLKAPNSAFYGGDRKGKNLYANCLVALDASTGKLLWYFQFTHHDIWDYDPGAPPALIDVMQQGKKIRAVAQITKLGLLFLFDSSTGKPLFGVEERAVPKSEVPGEETWPTQPFPLKPPPLARLGYKPEEIANVTPEQRQFCEELFGKDGGLHGGGPYTPYGLKQTIVFPGTIGGGNWGGVSFDPKLGYIFVNTQDLSGLGKMVPTAQGSYNRVSIPGQAGMGRFFDPDKQMPCQQPPWGQLHAVNASTGEIAWSVPLGVFEELEAKGVAKTGTPNLGGPISTASGLTFIAATTDHRLRAFESRTGKELWSAKLEAGGYAVPVTYQGRNGKQYVVIVTGGNPSIDRVASDAVVAFSLPN